MTAPFYSDPQVTIHHANALALPLPDESVDLVVTSPPYFGLRSYQDGGEHYAEQIGAEATPREYLDALMVATGEMVRTLKPGGSIFVNLGDKYGRGTRTTVSGSNSKQGHADPGRVVPTGSPKSLLLIPERYRIRAMDDLGLTVRAVVIWEKTNAVPESARDRVSRVHEDWVHLVKSPSYYSDVSEIHDGPRWPSSVWRTRTGAGEMKPPRELTVPHFAPYPLEWPRRIIQAWCPPGGTVLDPFGGTGTTILAAKTLGRGAHYVDLSRDYCRLAQWRVNDPAELTRAAGQPAPRALREPHEYETDLLEGWAS